MIFIQWGIEYEEGDLASGGRSELGRRAEGGGRRAVGGGRRAEGERGALANAMGGDRGLEILNFEFWILDFGFLNG